MSRVFVQPPDDDDSFDAFLEYAKEYGYNMEIASFAYSNVLDSNWRDLLEKYQQKLRGFAGTISLHGAFQDLVLHSRDARVREVARDRILQNLEIAVALNAKYVVFHGNLNPLITQESYKRNWVAQNASFWSEALSKYDVIILLENLWEPTPEVFRKLLDEVGSPRLKVCFDTGHANIFSKASFEEWIAVLGKDIPYMHVNDNEGGVDNELVPGEGTIDWREFSDVIEKYRINPQIVLEVGTLEKTRRTVELFKGGKVYPFQS